MTSPPPSDHESPVLAISIGDVNGIGPEVVLAACARSTFVDLCRPVLVGPFAAAEWYRSRLGIPVRLERIADPSEAPPGVLSVIDRPGAFRPEDVGTPTADSGAIAVDAIEASFGLWRRGRVAGLVTAPINKHAIALAGSPFAGHTDMLASLCGSDGELMVLAGSTMRVGLVTIHVPLSAVVSLITRERVHAILRRAHAALQQDFGIARPRIAVLALNPHAGDDGAIGDEERDIIAPALHDAAAEGIAVEGPVAADGFFSAHNRERHDMIIAMYHDQGLIPFKMQAAGHGVNVTCGLPIVRTSPDHGTAHAIAGTGRASERSMAEAIVMARAIHRARAAWDAVHG